MTRQTAGARIYRTRMSNKERSLLPKVINTSVESGKDSEYTITIVSSGYVHAVPDPLFGKRYYYGNPKLAKGKVYRFRVSPSARIKLSKVVETDD